MTPTQRKSFEKIPPSVELKTIAELIGGEVVGDPHVKIGGVAGIKEAKVGDITFLSNLKYLSFLEETKASAVITFKDTVSPSRALIRCSNPSQAFTKIIDYFMPKGQFRKPGFHKTAVIGENVSFGEGVFVGPQVVIEDNCAIGNHTVINAHVYIGHASVIGNNSYIHPNVTIREESEIGSRVIIHSGSVIGSDGYGYETIEDKHVKIPQTGTVKIEDDVEIGANVCVDRGRFGKTWIKKGTKIDNLVQIAHNVVIGENCLIVSQAGISGSSRLGDSVVIAGQAGLVGHIELGDRVVVGAGSGVTKSIPANTVVLGQPARPIGDQKKILVLISKLPELFKDLAEIKKKLKP